MTSPGPPSYAACDDPLLTTSTTTAMKALSTTLLPLLTLLASTAVLAVPTGEQVVLDDLSRVAKDWQHAAEDVFHKGEQRVMKWVQDGKEFIKQHDITCEYP